MLSSCPPQLSRAREDAASGRTEAARARAEAEFERERSNRLTESLDMQRQQMETLMGRWGGDRELGLGGGFWSGWI